MGSKQVRSKILHGISLSKHNKSAYQIVMTILIDPPLSRAISKATFYYISMMFTWYAVSSLLVLQ